MKINNYKKNFYKKVSIKKIRSSARDLCNTNMDSSHYYDF